MTLTPAKYKAAAAFVGATPWSCRIQATAFRFWFASVQGGTLLLANLDGERNA